MHHCNWRIGLSLKKCMTLAMLPPCFDRDAGSLDRREPVEIEAVISEGPAETFDKRVLLWFAGRNEARC